MADSCCSSAAAARRVSQLASSSKLPPPARCSLTRGCDELQQRRHVGKNLGCEQTAAQGVAFGGVKASRDNDEVRAKLCWGWAGVTGPAQVSAGMQGTGPLGSMRPALAHRGQWAG